MSLEIVHDIWRNTDLSFAVTATDDADAPLNLTGATLSVEVSGPLTITATITNAAAGLATISAPYDDAWLDGRLMWFQPVITMAGGQQLGFPRVWVNVR